ncbi:probable multidrug resistance-associated protein lethal(2)03659 [Leptopilina heterotoma]|uniref:probable multidrug resistance-associated protein lethal(2)03659 n=1 Tax=Leptopilina heterotoma TaxID=63436 RepID=UPI001CA97BD2|nr:probable multidrug resistance-associated protein lethal(2)03659 [Leptopilina heterotoma]
MYLHYVWMAPLQGILIVYIIYTHVGLIVISGVSFFFLFITLQGFLAKLTSRLWLKASLKSDERLELIKHIIRSIQTIKINNNNNNKENNSNNDDSDYNYNNCNCGNCNYNNNDDDNNNNIVTNLTECQKIRIALARMIYFDADIYLLDDIFPIINKEIRHILFNEVLSKFLQNKTRILITNDRNHLEYVDIIYHLAEGKILNHGNYKQLHDTLEKINLPATVNDNFKETSLIENMENIIRKCEKTKRKISNQIPGEKIKFQLLEILKLLNWWSIGFLFILFFTSQIAISAGNYFIVYSSTDEGICHDEFDSEIIVDDRVSYSRICMENNNWIYISTFSGLMTIGIIVTLVKILLFANIWKNISEKLQNNMLRSMVKGGMKFFYENTLENILKRFSKDVKIMDKNLPQTVHDIFFMFFVLLSLISLTMLVNYWLMIPIIISGLLLYFLTTMYIKASSTLHQLNTSTELSLQQTVKDTLNGLSSIQSLKAEQFLIQLFHNHQNKGTKFDTLLSQMSHCYCYYIDIIFILYLTIMISIFILTKASTTISDIGFILTQTLSIVAILKLGLYQLTQFPNEISSISRIIDYSKNIISEKSIKKIPTKEDEKSNFPQMGKIQFLNVKFRYTMNHPIILNNANFIINPGEKIGIVGNCPSDKYSLIAALFRLGEIEGEIFIDNSPTSEIKLEKLRSKISIIQLEEENFILGTLRDNIDPNGEYSNNDILQALNTVGLYINGLETKIVTINGRNFNHQRRLLISLARAFIRRNKILIINDEIIINPLFQRIFEKFTKSTIIIVVNSLNTLMNCDKIIVLNNGETVDFGHPIELVKTNDRFFSNIMEKFVSM